MYRNELKYICSRAQVEILKIRLKAITIPDIHSNSNGMYNVRSMYFDDLDNSSFYENENGNDPREKYRIRIYSGSKKINLELKSKFKTKTKKQVVQIGMDDYSLLSASKPVQMNEEKPHLLRKLSTEIQNKQFRPVVIVDYNRVAYTYKVGNIRITFDTNISSSNAYDKFFEKNIPKRSILPNNYCILEVKYNNFIPDFIKYTLQTDNLISTSFSKFYLCRKYNMVGGLLI